MVLIGGKRVNMIKWTLSKFFHCHFCSIVDCPIHLEDEDFDTQKRFSGQKMHFADPVAFIFGFYVLILGVINQIMVNLGP